MILSCAFPVNSPSLHRVLWYKDQEEDFVRILEQFAYGPHIEYPAVVMDSSLHLEDDVGDAWSFSTITVNASATGRYYCIVQDHHDRLESGLLQVWPGRYQRFNDIRYRSYIMKNYNNK